MSKIGITSGGDRIRFRRSGPHTPRAPICRPARHPRACRVCKKSIAPGDYHYFFQYPEDHPLAYSQDVACASCGFWRTDDREAVLALTRLTQWRAPTLPEALKTLGSKYFLLTRDERGALTLSEIGKALYRLLRASRPEPSPTPTCAPASDRDGEGGDSGPGARVGGVK